MKLSYLEVTYRKGQPLAAYYYLPREDASESVRTEPFAGGLVVDYADNGKAIGIEITSPTTLDLSQLNDLLMRLGQECVESKDLVPLVAA